ncbi:succinylglutamate desuccinylase [Paraburkholderia flava]|uniref:succinylglutamate desuccinylase n=1 Tax=Paraburkholderia flava TaxID=2547393 RepID=UPI00105DF619|nr:succinylglutamate desuccinylase [Paraburkholderia flava]
MTSSAESNAGAMLADFLAWTLAGERPLNDEAQGVCANGVRWTWLDDGVLQFEPASVSSDTRSVLASAGVHGDETAPIELLSRLVRDIAEGRATLACRLLVLLGNVDAMRGACRYLDDDLNRLFGGRYTQLPQSRETPRAIALEQAAKSFFASAGKDRGARWHIDMHTAIRGSVFERFALLPYTGAPLSRAMFEWLGDAGIDAVLLHTTKANTYSHFTAEHCDALACTLELGKVRLFGQNDLTRFSGADDALRRLLAGESAAQPVLPRVFTVIDQITKQSDAFELLVAADVPNFTPFAKDTLLARDGDYRYAVRHDEERIVFPNPTVKPGLRAGLLVIDTTRDTHATLDATT